MIIQGQYLDTESSFGRFSSHKLARSVWSFCNSARIKKKFRKVLRKKIARKLRGPYDVVIEDLHFRLYPAENLCDRTIFSRSCFPEADEHKALSELVKPGMVFVDIGANIGSYAAYLGKKVNGQLRILAFEPHPVTYQKLIFNMKSNMLGTDDIVNMGCGPKEELLDLWSDGGGNVGQTSLLQEATNSAQVKHQVQIRPLIDVLNEKQISQIDIMKIDIEGFEDQALVPFFTSAPETLYPKYLLIETL